MLPTVGTNVACFNVDSTIYAYSSVVSRWARSRRLDKSMCCPRKWFCTIKTKSTSFPTSRPLVIHG